MKQMCVCVGEKRELGRVVDIMKHTPCRISVKGVPSTEKVQIRAEKTEQDRIRNFFYDLAINHLQKATEYSTHCKTFLPRKNGRPTQNYHNRVMVVRMQWPETSEEAI